MKPFTLDTVLKYRTQLEDKAAIKLSEAQRIYHETKSQYEKAIAEYSSLYDQFTRNQEFGVDVGELSRFHNRLTWLKGNIKDLEIELSDKRKKVVRQREEVILRSREKKVLEQLKQKQNLAYKNYLDKKETSQLDEIAVLSHDRKKQEND